MIKITTDAEHKETEEKARAIITTAFEDAISRAVDKGIQLERERLRKQVVTRRQNICDCDGYVYENMIDIQEIDIWDTG